jgi:hypothetical protein
MRYDENISDPRGRTQQEERGNYLAITGMIK